MNNLTNTKTTLDDFTIERVIGKGSFGSVYLVTRKQDQKLYALKTVYLSKLNKKEQENSVNEVRLLASISHPNVIGYKEAFWEDKSNSLNIIMEYADDGDLQKKINKKKSEGKYFKEQLIWLYSIQMIEGLKALHDKKIMHRDIKSANIFLTKKKYQCKIGDMNVSKVIKEKVLTTQTGTPYYASPEVWRDEPYSYKSDLWSIGCVIYEMCALRPPFNGKDLDDLFENVCRGKVKRISSFYSDDLWNMILMLLQNDVNKRVDCDGFLNSDLIKSKINEFKSNPNTHYEGCELEKNRSIKIDNDILYGTINFKNFNDLKNKLPNVKNYENNIRKKNTKLKNDNSINNINNILMTNSNMINNSNRIISIQNINNSNNSTHHRKQQNKKLIPLDDANSLYNKLNNLLSNKENQNKNIQLQNLNSFKQKTKSKDIIQKLPKNTSFKGISHSMHICKINTLLKNRANEINSSDRNLLIKKENKNKELLRIEKKKFKELEKIIEYNKIKGFLKISKRKENNNNNTNITERRKNENKKSFVNLFRNKTENNVKERNNRINYEFEDSGKITKNFSLIENLKKSSFIKRINTEQKFSLLNKLELDKYIKKRMNNTPSYNSIININQNKERSHSQGINAKTIESINNKQIFLKGGMNNIYYNLIGNINNMHDNNNNYHTKSKNKNINLAIKKINLPPHTPYSIGRKSENKTTKRNLTTIPYNNESINNAKSLKNNQKQNPLLNEIFNTVNLNKVIDYNIYNMNSQKNSYYLKSANYSEMARKDKSLKTRRIISKKKSKKQMSHIYGKKIKYIDYGFPDNNINHSNNNLFINHSYNINKNKININNLFNYKNYSIIINNKNKYENKDNLRNKSNENEYINFSKIINHSKKSPRASDLYNPLSLRQKSMASSIGCSLSNSNAEIIKRRYSFTCNMQKKIKKNKNVKNICIKKVNIPPFCNKNNSSNNNNNYIRYKRGFKNNLEYMDISEPLLISKGQKLNSKIKENKKILNISANGNHIISNPNSFLQNGTPIFLNIKSNQSMKGNQSYNLKRNKRINPSNSGYNLKNSKIVNSQIFNNYYSINNIDASNIPVRVINFYN